MQLLQQEDMLQLHEERPAPYKDIEARHMQGLLGRHEEAVRIQEQEGLFRSAGEEGCRMICSSIPSLWILDAASMPVPACTKNQFQIKFGCSFRPQASDYSNGLHVGLMARIFFIDSVRHVKGLFLHYSICSVLAENGLNPLSRRFFSG